MFPYLIILSATSAASLAAIRRSKFLILTALLVYVIYVGFRFQMGVDWNNYIYRYEEISIQPVMEILQSPEFGASLLYWFARYIGGGIIFVNFVSAAMFCVGLFAFANRCREPFLALTIATPYLVFVIAMSATRQAMALGIIFYLFATWEKRRNLTKVLIILLASSFHASALFMLVFVALGAPISALARFSAAVVLTIAPLVLNFVLPSQVGLYEERYVGVGAFIAEGALSHVLLVAIPAASYLLARKRWIEVLGGSPLLDSLAIATVLLVPFVWVSSIGADRMSLYFWPVAMYVGATWPALMASNVARNGYRLLVVMVSFTVCVGWFLLANSSWAYLPYKNYLWRPEGFELIRRR